MDTHNKSSTQDAPPPPNYNQATTGGFQAEPYPPTNSAAYPPQNAPAYPPQGAPTYPPQAAPTYPPQAAPTYPPAAGGESYPPQQTAGTFRTSPDSAPNNNAWSRNEDVEFTGMSFSDKSIRQAFIKKVYLILTCQLVVTFGFVAFFVFYSPARLWVRGNPWFYYVSYATFLVTYIALVCCPSVRRKWPTNFICLAIFTLSFSYVTATISSYYDTKIVLIAAGITAAVCLSISVFAMQTKIDFTLCSGLIFALLMVVIFFGFASIIVYVTYGTSEILQAVYGALAALLFALFLAYDTQMLLGGRKHELSPEEYIFGALQLYLDIVYIFIIILSCFGGKD